MGLRLFNRKRRQPAPPPLIEHKPAMPAVAPPDVYQPAPRIDLPEDPLQRQMQLERFGQLARHLPRRQNQPVVEAARAAAVAMIDECFALVPEGIASLIQTISDLAGGPEIDVDVNPFLLARHCVTNRQFQMFVDDGGYRELEWWPEDIWPHLIDFVDQTGENAPRYWREGRHDRRYADYPVVGVCFYEAAAFAKWAGYRLPTGGEWQMAASWRLRSAANVLRRYPWGDALDTTRCNIWASGVGHTSPVGDYEKGAAPNGVLQLIGNVWEWTDNDYEVTDDEGRLIIGDMVLKEIRGGAFDTYFAAQATSAFRTGLASLVRAHNVGFRCALDLTQASGANPPANDG